MRSFVRLVLLTFVLALVAGLPASAARAPSFTAPVRLGFQHGDDWEPAIAADRSGHVYTAWSHYVGYAGVDTGDPDPSCPTCASPHTVLQVSSDGGATWSSPRALSPSTTTAGRSAARRRRRGRQDGLRRVHAGQQVERVRRAVGRLRRRRGAPCSSSHFSAAPTRTSSPRATATSTSSTTRSRRSSPPCRTTAARPGRRTTSSARPIRQLGVSLPSGGAIDSKGNAYFAWNGVNNPGQAKGTKNLYVTRSTDGGATWTTSLVDVSHADVPLRVSRLGLLGLTDGARHRCEGSRLRPLGCRALELRVQRMYFARSVDGAATWSPAVDVSLAPAGSNHLFPAIAARGDGDVRIAWMDDRNGFDPGGDDPSARWNVYYRSSANGGTAWSGEAKLSQYVRGLLLQVRHPERRLSRSRTATISSSTSTAPARRRRSGARARATSARATSGTRAAGSSSD